MNSVKKGDKNHLLINLKWIGFANLIAKPIWLLFLILAARRLGVEEYGIYTFAISFVAIFAIFYEFGIDVLTTREVAINKEKSAIFFGNTLLVKLILALLVSAFNILIVHLLGYKGIILYALYWAVIFMLFSTAINYLRAFFRGLERINYEAYSILIEKALLCLCGGYALMSQSDVVSFLKLLALGNLASLICTSFLFKKLTIPKITLNLQSAFGILKKAWPFALMNIFMVVYFRIDAVMLSLMIDETAVGLYGSTYRIMEMLLMIPAVIMIPIYPAMSRLFKNDEVKFHNLSQITTKAMLLFSVPIAFTVFILANNLMTVFYGNSEFLLATPALKILVWVLPFSSLTCVLGTMLAATNKQKVTMRNTGICAGLNIALNLVFIPKFSFVGASTATLITEGVLVIMNFSVLRNFFSNRLFRAFTKKFVTLTFFYILMFFIFQVINLSPYLSLVICTFVFVIAALKFGLMETSLLKIWA